MSDNDDTDDRCRLRPMNEHEIELLRNPVIQSGVFVSRLLAELQSLVGADLVMDVGNFLFSNFSKVLDHARTVF